jgi:hypothetical protein
MGTDSFKQKLTKATKVRNRKICVLKRVLEIGFIILVASGGFLVLYSGTRDAKASNWLFDRSVLLLRLARLRSVAV